MNVRPQTNAMKMPTALTLMDLTPVPANRDSLEMGQLAPVWVFYLSFHVCHDPGYGWLINKISLKIFVNFTHYSLDRYRRVSSFQHLR